MAHFIININPIDARDIDNIIYNDKDSFVVT